MRISSTPIYRVSQGSPYWDSDVISCLRLCSVYIWNSWQHCCSTSSSLCPLLGRFCVHSISVVAVRIEFCDVSISLNWLSRHPLYLAKQCVHTDWHTEWETSCLTHDVQRKWNAASELLFWGNPKKTTRNFSKDIRWPSEIWTQYIPYPSGTALQAGRSRVRFPMVSLEFFINIIPPSALWAWGWLSF